MHTGAPARDGLGPSRQPTRVAIAIAFTESKRASRVVGLTSLVWEPPNARLRHLIGGNPMSRNGACTKPSEPPSTPAFRLKPLAIAVIAAHSPLAAFAQEQTDEEETGRTIEEVIVTATKREANMQDVAQSITAFTTDDLERLRARDMKEYIDALPSVALVNSVPGRNSVVFRGVSTGSSEYRTDSMTAVYLDEQPLTTNSQQVDPWLVDIARVEALPGPQARCSDPAPNPARCGSSPTSPTRAGSVPRSMPAPIQPAAANQATT